MFIVHTSDGQQFREGMKLRIDEEFTWDDIPKDSKISQIQLTYPFRLEFKSRGKSSGKKVSPLLTIGRYDRYFFYNEATIRMLVHGNTSERIGESQLEAKVVGGIDDEYKLVVETRMDKLGNCTIFRYPLKNLEARIKAGTFRADIIREGINN